MQVTKRGNSVPVPANTLQVQASYNRGIKVNWHVFLQTHLLSLSDFKIITDYDRGDSNTKARLIQTFKYRIGNVLLCLVGKVQNEEAIRYILVMIDDMLQEGRVISDIFNERPSRRAHPECGQFMVLLSSEDQFIAQISAKIISKLATCGKEPLEDSDVSLYVAWLLNQLGIQHNIYIQNVADCLQRMVRISKYQQFLIVSKCIPQILQALKWLSHTQVLYQLLYCIWRVTFNTFTPRNAHKYEVISVLAPLLLDSQNKIIRMVLGVYRNLIENSRTTAITNKYSAQMIQYNVLKYLSILQERELHDDDMTEDINFLNDKLQEAVEKISSFEAYSAEVKSGRLEWSPVHKSAQFWRENSERLSDNNHELLRLLMFLLKTSRDPLTLRVASFDVGQYISNYTPGKRIVVALGGKDSIMRLLSNKDSLVRTEALLTLQKIMIQNWDLLGRE